MINGQMIYSKIEPLGIQLIGASFAVGEKIKVNRYIFYVDSPVPCRWSHCRCASHDDFTRISTKPKATDIFLRPLIAAAKNDGQTVIAHSSGPDPVAV